MNFGYDYNNIDDYRAFMEYTNAKTKLKHDSTISSEEKYKKQKEIDRKQLQYFYDREKKRIESEKQKKIEEQEIQKQIDLKLTSEVEKSLKDIFNGSEMNININL